MDFTNLNDWNFDRSLEYDPKRKSGLVVFNWGCAINGTIGILIVAQEKDEIEYYKKQGSYKYDSFPVKYPISYYEIFYHLIIIIV